jgi:TolA-binding protein
MKRTMSLIAGILLAATMGGTALAGNGHGNGPKNGGNPNSQAGGLPALAAKVAALQTLVNSQGSEISTLQGQVGTLQGQVGTLQGQVTDLQGQNNWVVVTAAGAVATNSGGNRENGNLTPVTTITHTSGSGLYEVIFKGDVSNCSYNATLDDSGTTAAPGFVTVSNDSGNADDVEVYTYDSTGIATDTGFDLYLSCR